MTRPRCPRGHFLPADAPNSQPDSCRCALTRRRRLRRTRPSSDLCGQRATLRQLYTMTTIPLTGAYL
ncbi:MULTISPECIES: hypothetical protein [Streptomyces]|uniref:hypothetical protein n=1 Tax=Streptomyces TaxID=1883 RepID=UPI001679E93C|nr:MULTISPECIES: hypothetical protein [Streptomyces]MBK3524855.1 hypothetical protein [Streptomyces sp. MBT70]GGR70901.1 hypothetical protein GCM10010236_26440 [Streptomyces eurythermus]